MARERAAALGRGRRDHRVDARRRRRDIHRRGVVEQQIEIDVCREAGGSRRCSGDRRRRIAEDSHEQVRSACRVVDHGGAPIGRVGYGGGHVRNRDVWNVDRLGVERGLRRRLRRRCRAGYGLVIDGRERRRIGNRVEFRFRHTRSAIVHAGADREYERDRGQPHHHGDRAAFIAAEAPHRAPRALKQTDDIWHWTKPLRCYGITSQKQSVERRAQKVLARPSQSCFEVQPVKMT